MSNSKTAFSILNLPQFNSNTFCVSKLPFSISFHILNCLLNLEIPMLHFQIGVLYSKTAFFIIWDR